MPYSFLQCSVYLVSLVCVRKLCGMLWVFWYWSHNNLTPSLPPRFYLGSGPGSRLPPPSSGPEFIRPPQIHLRHFVFLTGILLPSNYPDSYKNQESRNFLNSEKGFSLVVPLNYHVIISWCDLICCWIVLTLEVITWLKGFSFPTKYPKFNDWRTGNCAQLNDQCHHLNSQVRKLQDSHKCTDIDMKAGWIGKNIIQIFLIIIQ